jgi:O-antigen/teichoic acid export membrane protein
VQFSLQQKDDISTPSPKVENPDDRIRNVTHGVGALTIQNVLTSILAFAFLAVLLRLMSPTEYNAYSSVLVTITVASTVLTFALQNAAARYVAMFQDDEKRWAVAKSILVLSLIFSITGTAIFEVIAPELSLYFMRNTQWTFLFSLGGLWLVSFSFSSILQGIVQGMKKYVLLAKMITVSRIVMLGFTVGALELYHNIDFAIIAWAIYYIILIVWPMYTIGPFLFRASNGSRYKEVMKFSTPLAISAILAIISSSGDSIVIGGHTSLLGAYNAAIQISLSLTLVLILPLGTILLPEAASSSGNNAAVSNVLRLAIRLLMILLLPASLILAGLSTQVLSLFSGGGIYLSATSVLEIVSSTYVFYGIGFVASSVLQATGRTIQVLIGGIATALADVALALLLVPSIGIVGGAISKAIEIMIGMVLSLYFVRRYAQNLDSRKFYLKATIASLIPFGIVFTLSNFANNRIITLIPYSIIAIVAFLVCIKIMKILNDEDRAFITNLLPARLQRLVSYL